MPETSSAHDQAQVARVRGLLAGGPSLADLGLTEPQRAILAALERPRTLDELAAASGIDPAAVRVELTMLELQRRVRREGTRVALAGR